MRIGDIITKNNIFLAPMAGVSDKSFRKLCIEQGCGLVYTEMFSAKGLYYNDDKTKSLTSIDEDELPVGLQVFGSEPDVISHVIEKLNTHRCSFFDINMGCPTPKITKNGDGSALMKNPKLIAQIIDAVVKVSAKPVTIKIRKGWDDNSINAVEIAQIAEACGASAVAIHGRTREQFYGGKADWDIIGKVKNSVKIPVIGNGDVFSPLDAKKMFIYTGCDAIMIGRAARGNPWIFNRVNALMDYGDSLAEPSMNTIIMMIKKHLGLAMADKGEYSAVREMRKHIAWYLKGLRNSSKMKDKIFKAENVQSIHDILDEYVNYNEYAT